MNAEPLRVGTSGHWSEPLTRWRELPILCVLVLVLVCTAVLEPRFVGAANVRSILLWTPLLTVVAMGQMLVILTRGIDVSVGSILGLAGMTASVLLRDHPEIGVFGGLAIGVAVGAICGMINGAIVTGLGVPPIVVTLGTLGVFRGLIFLISGGRQVDDYQLPRALARWSIDGPLGQEVVPWVVVLAVAATIVTHLFLQWNRLGRAMYAVGGNPEAASLRGIRVRWVTFLAYVANGACAGLAGVLYISRFGTINPATIGYGFELLVIAAVVIGGVSILGGAGTALGVFLGCLLLATVNVAMTVLDIAGDWQLAMYGTIILLAIVFDNLVGRRLRVAASGE
jgi:rhamnose transport system permease protein